MDIYLSEPKTQKRTKTQSGNGVKYTSCEMQGWRKHMEDAHIANLSVKVGDKTYCVFGVFDGHGGILHKLFRNLSI
jgi:serine/threonine protein phosphatase PrpC